MTYQNSKRALQVFCIAYFLDKEEDGQIDVIELILNFTSSFFILIFYF